MDDNGDDKNVIAERDDLAYASQSCEDAACHGDR